MNDLGVRSLAEMVELDDEILQEKLGEALADQQVFRRLKVLGFGRKGFILGEFYTVPVNANTTQGGVQSQTPDASRAASQDQSPQTFHETEHETTNGVSSAFPSPGPGTLNCNPQGNSPNQLPPHSFQKRSTNGPLPPSSLGKRTREEEVAIVPAQSFEECMMGGPSQRSLRRKVQRAGWDVLKRWEIWGLDSQEL
jgi:hypothetical protein